MSINKGVKLFHSSIRVAGSKTVYFDPWQIQEETHDADLIFVTHDHHDHYSPEDIAKISKPTTVLVVPEVMKEMVPGAVTVYPGESKVIAGIAVEAVPAYNIGRPFHAPEKRYVGYVAQIDGVCYYVAGDTDKTPDNSCVKCDVAFVPAGGKYTMDAAQAAELVNAIQPKIAVPTHYGTVTDSADAAEVFMRLVDSSVSVEIQP